MAAGWTISYIVLWGVVLLETVLLVLLLRALGELRQQLKLVQGTLAPDLEVGGLEVGKKAPSFTATDQYGNTVQLDNWQGQRRLLAFLSATCSTCQKTIGFLNDLLQSEPDLQVLVVGMDHDWATNREMAEKSHAQMPVLTTRTDVARDLYHVRMISAVFALDESGVIRAKKLIHEREQLDELLAEAYPVPTPG
jgi:methylamine dehydrogenase accessory protein MauD